jgi:serine/threonine-protein kinase
VSQDLPPSGPGRVIGRYALHGEIASGGMATVHFGRLVGPAGFSRTVAIKKLHPQFAKDPEFVSMFLDEARVAARIRHPNVVATLDVVATQGELFLVMDYVQGESLARLLRAMRESHQKVPPRIATAIVSGALQGLHAAHEARNERGEPLGLVHRDISPQNVLVGADGVPRVLDFGVAKAAGRVQTTREGQLKGKLAYMAPEQISGDVTRKTDIYAAGIVLWETLTTRRLFSGDNEGMILGKILSGVVEPPSSFEPGLPAGLDEVCLRALAKDPKDRYATAREMAIALERVVGVASAPEVGEWVETAAHQALAVRANRIAEIESSSGLTDLGQLDLATHIHSFPPTPSSPAPSSLEPPPHSQSSQLSSISLSKPGASLPPRRRTPWLFIGLGGTALLILIVVGLAAAFSSSPKTTSVAASSNAPSVTPTATIAVTSTVAPPATATDTATASVPVVTAKPTATQRTKPVATVRPTATATNPSSNCIPPYTLDSEGHKIWKKECL